MRKIALAALLAPMACVFGPASAADMLLVENGVSRAPIVVAPGPPPSTERAANELADYIEKISGARPDLIEGLPDPAPESAIWVGFQPILEELFPDIEFAHAQPEEILIVSASGHMAITGRDRMEGDTQTEHGTANAVYTFIQDSLGVRWLWPGPLGEDVPESDTVSLPEFVHRFSPTFLSRDVFIHARRWGNANTWTRLQRLALQSRKGPAGSHAYTDWWGRFKDTHPEYFALQPDGTRSGWPDPRTVKICKSNPAVWSQWLADAEESLRQDPALNYLRASPNDGHSSGICVCEHCRAWDRLDGPPWRFMWAGAAQEYVALSDRYVTFWNHLAEMLRERFPDRDDLYVRVNAYGPSTTPPLGPGLAENTVMGYVGHFPFTSEENRAQQKEQWKAWAEKAPNMLYRPNLWYWAGGSWSLPEIAMNAVMEDFRFLAENRCIGITIDSAWEHWATQGPQYYLLAQLAWDPFQDGHAVLDDYYRRGFGPAAAEVERYWGLMEEATASFLAAPDIRFGSQGRFAKVGIVRRVYNDEFLAKAAETLDAAAEKAADGPEVYRDRVAFVRAGLDFTKLLVGTIPVMDRVRQTNGRDADAVRQAQANWDRMEEIAREHGPMAIRFSTLEARMRGGYMGGVQDYLGPPSEEFVKAAERPDDAEEGEAPPPAQARVVPPEEAAEFQLVPAEEAGWELVFEDAFDREELGDDWRVYDGNWAVQDGHLVGSGALVLAKGFPGFQRLEFEAVTAVEGTDLFGDGREATLVVSDMSSFVQARLDENVLPTRTGYFFQFGGFLNARNQMRRAGQTLVEDENPDILIKPDKPHRIVVENDEGRLRFIVDGKPLFEAREEVSLVGEGQDLVGFYFYTRTKVRNVKVYVKPLVDDMI